MNKYRYLREKGKREERLKTIKSKMERYQKDISIAKEIHDDIKSLRSGVIDINSGLSNTDPVQGGGTSLEDRYNDAFDDIIELERELKCINQDNKALIEAVMSLPESEEKEFMKHLWMSKDESVRSLADKYNLSKSSVQRKSDDILLILHKKLYIEVPKNLDPK